MGRGGERSEAADGGVWGLPQCDRREHASPRFLREGGGSEGRNPYATEPRARGPGSCLPFPSGPGVGPSRDPHDSGRTSKSPAFTTEVSLSLRS